VVATAVANFAASCLAASGEGRPPTAGEVLQRFADTQDQQRSFILKCEDTVESTGTGRSTPFRIREVREVRTDGERCYIHTSESEGNNGFPNLPLWRLWDGRQMLTYSHARQPQNDYLIIDKISVSKANLEGQGYDHNPSRGYLGQDKERMDAILRHASKISVRLQTERVGNSDCWVIDAVAPQGKYTVWVDPQHGYNLAKAEVHKGEGDRERDTVLPKNTTVRSSVVNVRFSSVAGTWVPMEAQSTLEWRTPEGWSLAKTTHKITEITLNPDHQKARSFALMPIRNGAQVVIAGAPQTPAGRWIDGEIIDTDGNRVDVTRLGYGPLPDPTKRNNNASGRTGTPDRVLTGSSDVSAPMHVISFPSDRCAGLLSVHAPALDEDRFAESHPMKRRCDGFETGCSTRKQNQDWKKAAARVMITHRQI